MSLKRFLIFLVHLFSLIYIISAGEYEDIEKISAKIVALTQPSINVIEKIREISEEAKKFVNLLGPAASLIVTTLDVATKTNSKEITAINLLKDSMDIHFNNMDRKIANFEQRSNGHSLKIKYIDEVDMKIAMLRPLFRQIGLPGIDKADLQEQLKNYCTNQYSPIAGLRWLKIVTKENCNLLNEQIAKNVSNILHKFNEYELKNRFKKCIHEKTSYYQGKALLLSEIFSDRHHITNINFLDESISVRKAVKQIRRSTTTTAGSACYQQTIALNSQFTRDAILAISSRLTLDIIRLGYFAGLCTNVSHIGQKDEIKLEEEEIGDLASEILSYLADWSTQAIIHTWPNLAKTYIYAIAAVNKEITTKEDLEKTNSRILYELQTRGNETWLFNIIAISKKNTKKNGDVEISINNEDYQVMTFELLDIKFYVILYWNWFLTEENLQKGETLIKNKQESLVQLLNNEMNNPIDTAIQNFYKNTDIKNTFNYVVGFKISEFFDSNTKILYASHVTMLSSTKTIFEIYFSSDPLLGTSKKFNVYCIM